MGWCLYLGDVAHTVVAIADRLACRCRDRSDPPSAVVPVDDAASIVADAAEAAAWGVVVGDAASVIVFDPHQAVVAIVDEGLAFSGEVGDLAEFARGIVVMLRLSTRREGLAEQFAGSGVVPPHGMPLGVGLGDLVPLGVVAVVCRRAAWQGDLTKERDRMVEIVGKGGTPPRFVAFAHRQPRSVHRLLYGTSVRVDRLDPLIEGVVFVADGAAQRIGDAKQVARGVVAVAGLVAQGVRGETTLRNVGKEGESEE